LATVRDRRVLRHWLVGVVAAIGTLAVLAAIGWGLLRWYGAGAQEKDRQRLTDLLDKVSISDYQRVGSQFKDSPEPPEGLYIEGYFVGPPTTDSVTHVVSGMDVHYADGAPEVLPPTKERSSGSGDDGMKLVLTGDVGGCGVRVVRFDPSGRAVPSVGLSDRQAGQVRSGELDLVGVRVLCDNDF
jgi:hypothetical protein